MFDVMEAIARSAFVDGLAKLVDHRLSGETYTAEMPDLNALTPPAQKAAILLFGAADCIGHDWPRAAEIACMALPACEEAAWPDALSLATCFVLLPALAHAEEHVTSAALATATWAFSAQQLVPEPWSFDPITDNLDAMAETAAVLGLVGLERRTAQSLLALLAHRVRGACRNKEWARAAQFRGRYLRWWRAHGAALSPDQPDVKAWDQYPVLVGRIGEQVGVLHTRRLLHGALLMENFAVDGALARQADIRFMEPRHNEAIDRLAQQGASLGPGERRERMASLMTAAYGEAQRGPFRHDAAVEDIVPLRHQLSPEVWRRFASGYCRRNAEHGEAVIAEVVVRLPDAVIGREADAFALAKLQLPHFTLRICGFALRWLADPRVNFAELFTRIVEHPQIGVRAERLIDLVLATTGLDDEIGQAAIGALLDVVKELRRRGELDRSGNLCRRVVVRLGPLLMPTQRSAFAIYRDVADTLTFAAPGAIELLHREVRSGFDHGDRPAVDRGIALLDAALMWHTGKERVTAAKFLSLALTERALRQDRPDDFALLLDVIDAAPDVSECGDPVIASCLAIALDRVDLAGTVEAAAGRVFAPLPDLPVCTPLRDLLARLKDEAAGGEEDAGGDSTSSPYPSARSASAMAQRRWRDALKALSDDLAETQPRSLSDQFTVLLALSQALVQTLELHPEDREALAERAAGLAAHYRVLLCAGPSDDDVGCALHTGVANALGYAATLLHPFLVDGAEALLDIALELLEMALKQTARIFDPVRWSAIGKNLALAYTARANFDKAAEAVAALERAATLLSEVLLLDRTLAASPDPRLQQAGETLDLTLISLGKACFELAERTYDARTTVRKSIGSAQWLRKAMDALKEGCAAAAHAGRPEIAATADLMLATAYARICERYVVERGWAGNDLSRAMYDWLCAVAGGNINTSEYTRLCGEAALTCVQRALKLGLARNSSLLIEAIDALIALWATSNRAGGVWPYVADHILLTLVEAMDDLGAPDVHGPTELFSELLQLRKLTRAMVRVAWYRNVTDADEDLAAAHAGFTELSTSDNVVTRSYAKPRARWLEVEPAADGILVNGLYLGSATDGIELRVPSQRRTVRFVGIQMQACRARLRPIGAVRERASLSVAHVQPILMWDDLPQEIATLELSGHAGETAFDLVATRLPLSGWDGWLIELSSNAGETIRIGLDMPLLGVYSIETRSLDPKRASINHWKDVILFGGNGLTLEVTLPPGTFDEPIEVTCDKDRVLLVIRAGKALLVLKSTPRIVSADVAYLVKEGACEAAICGSSTFPLTTPGHNYPTSALHHFAPLFFFDDRIAEKSLDLINQLDIRELFVIGLADHPAAQDEALNRLFDARREIFFIVEEAELPGTVAAIERFRTRTDRSPGGRGLLRAAVAGTSNHDPLESIQIVVAPREMTAAASQMLLDLAAMRLRPYENVPVLRQGKLVMLSASGNPGGAMRDLTMLRGPTSMLALVERYCANVQQVTHTVQFLAEDTDKSNIDLIMPKVRNRPILLFPSDDTLPAYVPLMRHLGALALPASEAGLQVLGRLHPPKVYVPSRLATCIDGDRWPIDILPDAPADIARWFQNVARDAHAAMLEALPDEYPHLLPSRSLIRDMAPSDYVVLAVEGVTEAPWNYLAANYAAALGAPLLLIGRHDLPASLVRQMARHEERVASGRPPAGSERHVMAQGSRRLPTISSSLLPHTCRTLSEMKPRYVGIVSSLIELPIELAGQPPLGQRFAIGRIAGPSLTDTAILVTRAALGEDVSRPATVRAFVAEGASAVPGNFLAGALVEAGEVYDLLAAQIEVNVRKAPPGRDAFLAGIRDAHLIHFAGHGSYDDLHPEQSGFELADGLLSADQITEILAGAPIIFGNACETGRVRYDDQLRSQGGWSGLAAALIAQGAVNYIGSLWPIDDEQSRDAAKVFYSKLCYGASVGEALRLAREHVFSESDTTWAAFVLFGCPRNRLRAIGTEN